MRQNGKIEPNYGNRPVETESVVARLAKYLSEKRVAAKQSAGRVEPAREAKQGLTWAGIKLRLVALIFLGFFAILFMPVLTKHMLLLSLSVALPVGFVAGMRFGGGRAIGSLKWGGLSALLAVTLFWGANEMLDDGARQEQLILPIDGKYVSQEKKRNESPTVAYYVTYILTIPPDSEIRFVEGVGDSDERLKVSEDVYVQMLPGQSAVSVAVRQGYFDMPWLGRAEPVPFPSLP